MARAGLILLFALIGAALVTRRYYYYGPYYTYQVLDIPGSYPQVALGVLAAVGVVLMLVAVRLRRTRRRTAGRFARAGARRCWRSPCSPWNWRIRPWSRMTR